MRSAFGVEHIEKSRLSSAARNALPDSAFADPNKRRFPMHDAAHRGNALARAHQGFAGGKLKRRIERRADEQGT